MTTDSFRSVFHPRSIAVIGASDSPRKFGGRTYRMLVDRKEDEEIFGVNPNVSEIEGQKVYDRLQEIPNDVEFAIITVPAPAVLQAVKDCAEKKVRVVQILASGFRETGTPEGISEEKEMVKIARENGMRIIGPNCFGVYSPQSPLTIVPGADYPRESGTMGFFAQSGGFADRVIRHLVELGIRFSGAVSYGNASDMNELDFLSFFRDDDNTKVVAAYIEGFNEGRQFMELVKETALKKPVIIWKAGLSEQGSRAVTSHTASLAGRREIWDGFFRQTGAIPAGDLDELIDLAVGFHCVPNISGSRFSVIGGGGAIGVSGADELEKKELAVLPFTDKTRQAVQAHIAAQGTSPKNPVDVGAPLLMPQIYEPVLDIITQSGEVDALVVEHWTHRIMREFDESIAAIVPNAQKKSGKPFLVTMPQTSASAEEVMLEAQRRQYREWYISQSIPVFDSLPKAANVLKKILTYNDFKRSAV